MPLHRIAPIWVRDSKSQPGKKTRSGVLNLPGPTMLYPGQRILIVPNDQKAKSNDPDMFVLLDDGTETQQETAKPAVDPETGEILDPFED